MIFVFLLTLSSVLFSESMTVDIEFSTDDFSIEQKGDFYRVNMEGALELGFPGEPCIPAIPINILLPPNTKATNVQISNVEFETLANKINLIPIQPQIIKSWPIDRDIPFVEPNQQIYSSNNSYPESPIIFSGAGNLSGYSIAGGVLYPIIYYPASGYLKYVKQAKLSIEYEKYNILKPIRRTPKSLRIIEDFVTNTVINPSEMVLYAKHFIIDSLAFDYLIVSKDPILSSSKMDRLRLTLRRQGWNDTLLNVSSITAADSGEDLAAKIRNKIRQIWQSNGIIAVVLAGDMNLVPERTAWAFDCEYGGHPYENYIPCDLYFSDLDSNWNANGNSIYGEIDDEVDLYPDVFVGRVSSSNKIRFDGWVDKYVEYVENTPTDFATKALFLGQILWRSPYTSGGDSKKIIAAESLPSHFNLVGLYESDSTNNADTAYKELNNGYSVLNHDGHAWTGAMGVGSGEYLSSMHADLLYNAPRCGVLYSIGCWPAAFDFSCIAEHFINNSNGGLITFVGNSRYGWGSPGNPGYGYSDIYDRFFWKYIFNGFPSAGVSLAAVKANFVPLSKWENVWRWKIYEVNVLGEPMTPIWQDEPTPWDIALPESMPSTGGSIVFPCDNCIASAIQDGKLLTTIEGEHFVNLDIVPDGINPIEISISDPAGFKSLQIDSILFDDVPYISIISLEPEFALPGDTIHVEIQAIYSGSECSLLTINPNCDGCSLMSYSISPDSATTGDTLLITLDLIVDSNLKDNSSVTLILNPICNVETLNVDIALPVRAPVLKAKSMTIFFSCGIFLEIELENIGGADFDGTVKLNSLNGSITFFSDEFEIAIAHGDTATGLIPHLWMGDTVWIHIIELDYGYGADTIYLAFPDEFYYFDDVDDTTDRIFIPDGLWHISTEEYYSEDHSYYCTDTITGFYPNNANEWLVSQPFVSVKDMTLSFWIKFNVTTFGSDGIYVYYISGGDTTILDFMGAGGALPVYSFEVGWTQMTYLLPTNPGDIFKIAFQFVSDNDDTAKGFALDDIKIGGLRTIILEDIIEAPVFNDFSISIKPNPFNSSTQINLDGFDSGILEIFDLNGRLIFNQKIQNETIAWKPEKLSSGVYLVRATSGKYSVLKRVIYLK